jgi:membrane protein YdbS with pleckstrin-like domain
MTAHNRPEKLPDNRRSSRPLRRTTRAHNQQQQQRGGTIDLRTQFPIAYRVILKRSLSWVAGWFGFLALLILVHSGAAAHLLEAPIGQVMLGGFAVVSIVFVIKLTYEWLYRASYYYAIEAGYLVISKGIIIRQRGSFPLSRITDVYLDRTVSDFVFGLYDLHVSTPTVDSGRFARIDGLPRDSAVHLQRSLVSLIEVTHNTDEPAPRKFRQKEAEIERAVHEE